MGRYLFVRSHSTSIFSTKDAVGRESSLAALSSATKALEMAYEEQGDLEDLVDTKIPEPPSIIVAKNLSNGTTRLLDQQDIDGQLTSHLWGSRVPEQIVWLAARQTEALNQYFLAIEVLRAAHGCDVADDKVEAALTLVDDIETLIEATPAESVAGVLIKMQISSHYMRESDALSVGGYWHILFKSAMTDAERLAGPQTQI